MYIRLKEEVEILIWVLPVVQPNTVLKIILPKSDYKGSQLSNMIGAGSWCCQILRMYKTACVWMNWVISRVNIKELGLQNTSRCDFFKICHNSVDCSQVHASHGAADDVFLHHWFSKVAFSDWWSCIKIDSLQTRQKSSIGSMSALNRALSSVLFPSSYFPVTHQLILSHIPINFSLILLSFSYTER